MSWAKLDDGFWMHPKVVMAGNEAAGIFARCLSYCSAKSRQGAIPIDVALEIAGSATALADTITSGLLERRDDHLLIPDFARLRGPLGRSKLPRWLRAEVIARDGFRCGLCGGNIANQNEVHIDHIMPVALGGQDRLDNLQVAHPACNIKKGARV